MSKLEKLVLGCFAGFVSVLSKFLAQDYHNIAVNGANLTQDQILNYQIGYGILTPILVIIGGFIAWVSNEPNRLKLVALSISAPSLITTWAGGNERLATAHTSLNFFFSSAYAQPAPQTPEVTTPRPDGSVQPPTKVIDPNTPQDLPTTERIKQGIGIFFGYGKEPPKYRVVAGSFANSDYAKQFADSINKKYPNLAASVVPPMDDKKYYRVILGDYTVFSKASELRQFAVDNGYSDAWISPERQSPSTP